MGYEIAEQLGWRLPDHLILPTAGGTLLPKVARAFQEFTDLGWVKGKCQDLLCSGRGLCPCCSIAPPGPGFHQSRETQNPGQVHCHWQPGRRDLRPSGSPQVGWLGRGWPPTARSWRPSNCWRKKKGSSRNPPAGPRWRQRFKLLRQERINPEETIVVAITGNGYKTLDVFESPFEVGCDPTTQFENLSSMV